MPNKRITDLTEATYISASNFYVVYDPTATQDQNADGYTDFNKKVRLKNICTQVSQSAMTWFGTGAQGALNTTASVTFTTTNDQEVFVRNYTSLTVNAGHTMTVSNRCRGLLIYVGGDCTINGTVTMSGKGANSVGTAAHYVYQSKNYYGNFIPQYQFNSVKIYGSGSAGGPANTAGRSAGEGYTGGGGGGGGTGGAGAAGTSWSGGSGGGGGPSATAGAINGGAGGNGTAANTGGGAGNGGGSAGPGGIAGGTGTGGLIIFVVKGTFTLGNTGAITANGVAGGNGSAGGGGGSGGGRIIILYNQGYTNNGGTITANGGAGGGTAPTAGGSGGAGSITIREIGVW